MYLIALDVRRPCSVIFYVDSHLEGAHWERVPVTGTFAATSLVMVGRRVIPAVIPNVAAPGRYKVCTSLNQCGTLTVVP